MPPIEWDESFSIGNETIDSQHKRWIELYNELDRVMMDSIPTDLVRLKINALQIMQEYTGYHFRYEENFMKKIGYPELASHWRQHKNFDYKVFEYLRHIEKGGIVLNTEIIKVIRDWLIHHILHEDMKIRSFQESVCT